MTTKSPLATGGVDVGPDDETDDFARWVAPHLVTAANFASRLVGPDQRDDLLQDALTRAWRRWATFDPERGNPRSWLLAIVADQERQRRRRHARRPRTPAGTGPLGADVANTAGASIETRLDVDAALSQLARRQRMAIDLHYFVGLDVAETAAVMECAIGTVKSTLSDARARLRTLLEDKNGD